MRMKKITKEEFRKLTHNADVLSADAWGDKVFQTPDNKILKLYRQKRIVSSASLYPYARRFAQNSLRLKKLGINTVTVDLIYDIPSIKRHMVIYERLPGIVLRDALASDPLEEKRKSLLLRFASFVALLHEKGILFRSLHFANVLILPSGDFALIDISSLRHHLFRSLSLWQRMRNFRHMCRYREDLEFLHEAGFNDFLDGYLENSRLQGVNRLILKYLAKRYFIKKIESTRS
jgi:tRNA A-37 threonylcarbamoyl transferase component Bud32